MIRVFVLIVIGLKMLMSIWNIKKSDFIYKCFCFNFDWLEDVDESLEHKKLNLQEQWIFS